MQCKAYSKQLFMWYTTALRRPNCPKLGSVADLGGAASPPLASFRKIQGLPISKIVRTADSTIIIITNFYLAASSREIFLRKCLLLYHIMWIGYCRRVTFVWDPIQPMQSTSSGTNKTRPDKKRSKQCRYAIEVTLIYFNTLFAIGAIPTRFIKSGKFLTQPDTIQSNPWIDLTHHCLWFNPNYLTFVLDFLRT